MKFKLYVSVIISATIFCSSISSAVNIGVYIPGQSGGVSASAIAEKDALPTIDGETVGTVLVTNCDDAVCAGTGTLHVPHYWNGTAWVTYPGAAGGIADIVEDTTPQLGGNLDTQAFTVDGRDVSVDGAKLDLVETVFADPSTPGTTTAGIQEAIDSCGSGVSPASLGCEVKLQCGEFEVDPITVGGDTLGTAKEGVSIVGCGPGRTNGAGGVTAGTQLTLAAGAPAGSSLITFASCRHCSLRKVALEGNGVATANGIELTAIAHPSTMFLAKEVLVKSFLGIGMLLGSGTQIDFLSLEQTSFRDVDQCYVQTGAQHVSNVLKLVECQGNGSPLIDVQGGAIHYAESYFTTTENGQVGARLCSTCNWLVTDNRFELGGANSIALQNLPAGSGGTRDSNVISGNAFVVQNTGISCVDWDRRGHLSFNDNSLKPSGSGADAGCPVTVRNTSSTDPLYVDAHSNSVHGLDPARDLEIFQVTAGANALVSRESYVSDVAPGSCEPGQELKLTTGSAGRDRYECVSQRWQATQSAEEFGLRGSYATWETVEAMMRQSEFLGLDPSITWTDIWVDPYEGDDSAAGTELAPIRTIGEIKQRATLGARFVIDNRDADRTFSNMTFTFSPTTGTCIPGEAVTYGASDSGTILDIHTSSSTIVLSTDEGSTPANTTDVLTGATSGCTATLGTWRPTIWDGSTFVCETRPAVSVTLDGGCVRGGVCDECAAGVPVGVANAFFDLRSIPSSLEGRVGIRIEPAVVGRDWYIDGDRNGLSWAHGDTTEDDQDGNGLFVAGAFGDAASTFGCLGVVHAVGRDIADDFVSQHGEGCVKALHTGAVRIRNNAAATSRNLYTTHNGTLGRGGLVTVGGFGSSRPWSAAGGAPVATTGESYSIHIGTGRISSDFSDLTDAFVNSSLGGTSGKVFSIGHEWGCDNVAGTGAGCNAVSMTNGTPGSELTLVRGSSESLHANVGPSLSSASVALVASTANPLTARIIGTDLRSTGVLVRANSNFAAGINLITSGVRFSNVATSYILSVNAGSTVQADVRGVYDEAGNRWSINSVNANNILAARVNAGDTWSLHETHSRELDHVSAVGGIPLECVGNGCRHPFSAEESFEFPVPITDFLPSPIVGYVEPPRPDFGIPRSPDKTLVAKGNRAINPGSLTTGACASPIVVAAPGTLATDRPHAPPRGDINGLLGWGSTDSMRLDTRTAADAIEFEVCNPTGGTVDAEEITVDWAIQR